MPKPTLCIVHNTIGTHSAIAKIAMYTLEQALDAGYQVTAVANEIAPELLDRVEWLPLHVPKRLHLYQWLRARPTIRQAMGGRTWDITQVYQPQVAALADAMHCQFLTRAAYERNCLESRPGLRPGLLRAQQKAVLRAEDAYFRRWNPKTHLFFCSELTQREFHRYYGAPPRESILENACPPLNFPSDAEKQAARKALVGNYAGPVLGYLGGVDERKGYRQLIAALEGASDTFLLMGGPKSDGFDAPSLSRQGRFKSAGMLKDPQAFFAACDAFIIPSLFEPLGLVAFEAAAQGLPVISGLEVGALPSLLHFKAGVAWEGKAPLPPLIRDVIANTETHRRGAAQLTAALSVKALCAKQLAVYEQILREKRDQGRV